ncbi:MAG: PASTA domain-containing protein [Ruminococcus sp.]|nr:PASTA domain-containing protein [Ruminococcus sp.]
MRFCMNCMAQYEDSVRICPECGFEEGTQPFNARCIEPGQILADRYIVGMPLSIDGWFVKYIGWDALLNRKTAIYEYSPVRFGARNIGDTAITVLKEKEFYKYMERFVKKAQLLSQLHLPDNVASVSEIFEKNNTSYVITTLGEGVPLSEYIEKNGAVSPQMTEKMFLPMLRSIDRLHDSGFVIGGFSPDDLLVMEDGSLFLNSYLENTLFNITDDRTDITRKDRQRYFSYERLKETDAPSLAPACDVYSAAVIMHRMMGVPVPEAAERDEYFEKKHKDRLKLISSYHIRIDSNKEAALRNASYVDSAFRTPDMDSFIKELSGDKKVNIISKKGPMLPMWAKIAIPAACAALVAAGAVAFIMMNRTPKKDEPERVILTTSELSPEMTIVPSVVELSSAEAAELLGQSGLFIELLGREASATAKPDTVLSQSVLPGTMIERNSVIGLTLSAPQGDVTVPNFIGTPSESSVKTAEVLGLECAVNEVYSRAVAKGIVIDQSLPPYETAAAGTGLELTVSLGPDPADQPAQQGPIIVPNLINKSYEEALAECEGLGIALDMVGTASDTPAPEGTVVKQFPAPGAELGDNEAVRIEIAASAKGIALPDLVLMPRQEAESLLESLGLAVNTVQLPDEQVAAGLISAQDPPPGSSIQAGTAVTLTVSTGRAAALMPDVVGKPRQEAAKAVTDAGMAPMFVYGTQESDIPDDTVVAQSVAAMTELPRGSQVILTLNSSAELVETPALIGLTKDEAADKLAAAGFVLQVYTGDGYPEEGIVCAQLPAAGDPVRAGAEITVLLTDEEHASAVTISPDKATIAVGEEFTLKISCKNIPDLVSVGYELSEEGIVEPVYIDTQTLDMTFKGLKSGTVTVTIAYGGIERPCTVEVK